jgi:prolyl-tRNA editing enzyme YbaK/EbsC (Cys-tRNA(Pro) deacylase)
MNEAALPNSARVVQDYLQARGLDWPVILLPASGATAQDAADALGTGVERIGKTVVFGSNTATVAVVVSGGHRVDAGRLRDVLGAAGHGVTAAGLEPLRAAEIKQRTSFSIGGVSPFGLPASCLVVLDDFLAGLDHCFVSAGHPHAVCRVVPSRLPAIVGAIRGSVASS